MKHQGPHAARNGARKSVQRSTSGHTKKRTTLHRQIKEARALHHQIMLHPLSILAMLATGVLIVGWTLGAAADSYNVTAKVPAPPLTEGAAITSPTDSATTQTSPITVTGTCPDNSYVKLMRNGAFSGAAWCLGNLFSVQTALSSGANTLSAQDYNITDDPGPSTAGITITYAPPHPPVALPSTQPSTSTTSASSSTTTPPQPLLIVSDYHFQAFAPRSSFSWTLHINGGVAPYTVQTDWGDRQTSTQTALRAQDVTIEHVYTRPGYYPIVIHLTDAKNAATVLQLAALIRQPGATSAFSAATSDSSGTTLPSIISTVLNAKSWLWVAWPGYITLVLMAVSFWLGERQELRRLLAIQHSRPTPRFHHR